MDREGNDMKLHRPNMTRRQAKIFRYDTLDSYRRHLRWVSFWHALMGTVGTIVLIVLGVYLAVGVSAPYEVFYVIVPFVALTMWLTASSSTQRELQRYSTMYCRSEFFEVSADNSPSFDLIEQAMGDEMQTRGISWALGVPLRQLYFGSETREVMLSLDCMLQEDARLWASGVFNSYAQREACRLRLIGMRLILQNAMAATNIGNTRREVVLRRFDDMVQEWHDIWAEQLNQMERLAANQMGEYHRDRHRYLDWQASLAQMSAAAVSSES